MKKNNNHSSLIEYDSIATVVNKVTHSGIILYYYFCIRQVRSVELQLMLSEHGVA